MSKADELLNELAGGDGISLYSANPETEPHIIIDDDRNINVPNSLKRIAVQYDNNIETVTFDCPRYWDGHDLSTMRVFVNYKCADGNLGSYVAESPRVDETDENIIHFEWTLKHTVTYAAGKIIFLVCIKDVDEEGYEKYHWNTELCQDMFISEGLECDEISPEEYQDLYTRLLNIIDEKLDAENKNITSEISRLDSRIDTKANTSDLATVATSGSYSDLKDKPTIPTIDAEFSKTSTNGIANKTVTNKIDTMDATISGLSTSLQGAYDALEDKTDKTTTDSISQTTNAAIKKLQDADTQFTKDIASVSQTATMAKSKADANAEAINTKANTSDLATVATSGSYSDLKDKPTIPTIDAEFSKTSTNGIANKTVTNKIDAMDATISGLSTSLQGAYDALEDKTDKTTTDSISQTTNAAIKKLQDADTQFTKDIASVSQTATMAKSKADANAEAINTKANTSDLATVATSGSYSDLKDKPTIPTIDAEFSKTSTNGIANKTVTNKIDTMDATISGLSTSLQGAYDALEDKTDKTTTDSISQTTNAAIKKLQDADTQFTKDIASVSQTATMAKSKADANAEAINTKANTSDLATVATSGSYSDLKDKPTIPTIDAEFSKTSTNGIANKTVTNKIDAMDATISGLSTSLQGAYDALEDKTDKTTTDSISQTTNAAIKKLQDADTQFTKDIASVSQTATMAKSKADANAEAINTKANTSDLATVATSGSYSDLKDKPTIPTIDAEFSKTSTNGIANKTVTNKIDTMDATISGLSTSLQGAYDALEDKTDKTTTDSISQTTNAAIKKLQDADTQFTKDIASVSQTATMAKSKADANAEAINTKANTSDLATVATSGSYSDLKDKPTIPTIDAEFSKTSTNGIANKTVTNKIDAMDATISGLSTSLQGAYDALKDKADKSALPTNFVKSGSGAKAGLVPAPSTTAGTTKYLREDGTWTVPPNTTYSSLKNPYALTIQGNGTTLTNGTYDGSAAKTVNITPSSIGAAASSHSHSYLPLSGGTVTGKTTFSGGINATSFVGNASSATKLATARTINGVSFDGSANIIIPRSIKHIHTALGTEGSSGYVKIATIKITGTYADHPVEFVISQRGRSPYHLYVQFHGQKNTDPTLYEFKHFAPVNNGVDAYIVKSATSTWDIYIGKTEAYDHIYVLDVLKADGDEGLRYSITYTNVHVSSVPTTNQTKSTAVSFNGNAATATALTTSAGSATQPVYFSNGKPVATTYTLGKSVPSNAVFTDTKYTHPTTSGNKHIPSGGSSGQILRWSADGTAVWGADNNNIYIDFVKSGSSAAHGLVPAPPKTAGTTKYLREDGTWTVPPNTNTTYSAGMGISLSGTTFSNSGVRSIATGGTNGTISVNTNGTTTNVAVKGLGSAAYTASTAYASSSHNHNSTYVKKTDVTAQTVLYTSTTTTNSATITGLFANYSLVWFQVVGSKTTHTHILPLEYLKSKGSLMFKDSGTPINILRVSDTQIRWFEYQGQGAESYSSATIVRII